MALDNMADWASRARAASQRVIDGFEERMGYKPDAHEIRLVPSDANVDLSDLPEPARKFFSMVDEVSWPDIWNGYFLGPADETVRRLRDQDPGTVMVDSHEHRSLPIGSDGGGAYFVLDLDDSGVVRRVSDATVRDGILRGVVKEVAPDLDSFLECLIRNALLVADGQQPDF